ncbi:2-isopropylmalate synthase [Roseateles sp. DAIF2]|uniref:2-isopropylmalate synthase n=1 Tax=Roseateles sp. DAIF2 TaxID=2714952 RepID=UPI0018A27304|nr:2-isopropylmalate synthase [Roseateles sp. DAIF2]QPF76519.1 2-isopropylmalate synthase [Roseateles sp. DAIF2]
MLDHPATKYRPFPTIDLPARRWPARRIETAPIWLSTDLRDGNQALFEPMNRARKLRLLDTLLRCGFKEIELGFPAASQTDFDIVRELIEQDRIPADVTPMVMTQAREDLIRRTFEALRGARRAIVHLYNATAPAWRELVFGMTVPEMLALVETHVSLVRRLAEAQPETEWVLQYSPETFCMTELEVSLAACNTAIRAWDAGPGRPMIINLPTTVEVATPNVFADQVEWMHERLERREHLVLSVHPHNDRGTGVACAELALLAGAQRVEGCLFGNGERSGNVDLVTLALNLYTQGLHPGLDFSDLPGVAREAEACTALPIHPRHPYAGDLVFTAFSGSHQDAIKKGFAAQRPDAPWRVPYLPIDPQDIGRGYEGIVRVNSQSGKGGIAFLLEREQGLTLPRRMQVEFGAVVQKQADASEVEISAATLWVLFERHYLAPARGYRGHRFEAAAEGGWSVALELADEAQARQGHGMSQAAAVLAALGLVEARLDEQQLQRHGEQHWALIELALPGRGACFGAARAHDAEQALVQALLSAAVRLGAPT